MNAPFFRLGMFGDDASLLVALFIGIGFGFLLERGGFGSARKLAAQFYLRDLTVFKVMFTAIITAMAGLFWLSWIGFLDLSLVHLNETYLVPQIVGGLVFGVGFVMGGYCPGTSCVAAATGKLDALVHIGGMLAGIFLFGEAYPAFAGFYNSTSLGAVTIQQLFGISYNAAVAGVILLALGGFMLSEWIERRMNMGNDEQVAP